jgi:glycerophosphoryl diester phosphodiesterase
VARALGTALVALATATVTTATAQQPVSLAGRPLVIAHRGASGYRPEHTLGAYELAVEMGADCVEPDLVMTRDGALVARHEPEIGTTTDVALKFPDRRTRKPVDGAEVEGWFADDFTLAEIKALRARQPRSDRSAAWDGVYEIPTFQEVVDLVRREGAEKGRPVCVYPETKHPTYFAERGLDIDAALVKVLEANGYTSPSSPVIVQSFEVGNLRRLATMTKVRLVQLLGEPAGRPYDLAKSGDPRTYEDLMASAELREIATYAYGIGPPKRVIVGVDAAGNLSPPTSLIPDAHAAGLRVHPYTFRDEPRHLAKVYGNDPAAEYRQFYRLGVDGLFTDHPDTALRAREGMGGG